MTKNNFLIPWFLRRITQDAYNRIGSPVTQNVRNPFPMKTLVANELPILPDLDSPVPVVQQGRLTVKGKYFWKALPETSKSAYEVFGYSFWEKNAVSASEISDRLVAKGYIVRWNSVSQALIQLRKESNLKSLRFNHLPDQFGWEYSYCRYFFVKS